MLHVHPREEIIVASGAAEIHPVVPGNHLAGILTAHAALKLANAGVEMNHLVAIGTPVSYTHLTLPTSDLV